MSTNDYARRYRKKSSLWRFYKKRYHDQTIKYGPNYIMKDLPESLRAARSLEKNFSGQRLSKQELFFQQALLLKDYEDDYEYPENVLLYYPTYQGLTDPELRGYFAWRTKWRKGDFTETSFSLVFIYVYELLHLVGSSGPQDAYEKLKALGEEYSKFNPRINSYLRIWLADFVVYYKLDPILLADREGIKQDNSLFKLSNKMPFLSNEEIFHEVLNLSGSVLHNSRLYKQYPKAFETVVAGTLRRVKQHYELKCTTLWIEHYFGTYLKRPICLFDGAVFFDHYRRNNNPDKNQKEEIQVRISPFRSYRCIDGIWYLYSFEYSRQCHKRFMDLLKTIDSMMRKALNFSYAIRAKLKTKWILSIISEEIEKWLKTERQKNIEAKRKKLDIDLSQLGTIRSESTETRDKLLTEEEIEKEAFGEKPSKELQKSAELSESKSDNSNGGGNSSNNNNIDGTDCFSYLSAQERRYIQCLLEGSSISWITSEGLLQSLICDSINEKLYEFFEDTVIENGEVVEDYAEELKKGLSS